MGRPRVLSANGRLDAAERWYDGAAGPDTPIAREAPAPCRSCGFWVPLGGPLGQAFGACANEYAPDDGRVVSADHGCGAHSEGAVVAPEEPSAGLLLDEVGFDLLSDPTGEAAPTDDPDDPLALGHS